MAHGLGITGSKGIQYRIQNANNCKFKVYNVHETKFVFIKPCPGVGTTEKKKKKNTNAIRVRIPDYYLHRYNI